MTRNALFLTQKRVKPQLFSARKGSCGPKATTVYRENCMRRPLLFSVYLDVKIDLYYHLISRVFYFYGQIYMFIFFQVSPLFSAVLLSRIASSPANEAAIAFYRAKSHRAFSRFSVFWP